ncbi:hypothetical protein [Xenorhabdus nematophila]|nr:hypothetical protein [Xenorhabdus nematophila]
MIFSDKKRRGTPCPTGNVFPVRVTGRLAMMDKIKQPSSPSD